MLKVLGFPRIFQKVPWRQVIGSLAASAVVLCAFAGANRPAVAATVKGVVRLPANFKQKTPSAAPVFWTLPNAILPPAPPLVDSRRFMVVVIETRGASKTRAPSKPTITMEDSRFMPPVVAVAPKSKVTFLNNDGVLHLLEPAQGKFMSAKSVGIGDLMRHTFVKTGTYRIRCSEQPHMAATVLVTDQAHVAVPADDGTFRFDDVPTGRHLLRVWHDGKWIHRQPMRVRAKTTVEVRLSGTVAE